MTLEDSLRSMLKECSNSVCASVMGLDGISVMDVSLSKTDLTDDVLIELSKVLKDVLSFFQSANLGQFEDLTIFTSKYVFVFYLIDAQYFTALVGLNGMFVGQAKHAMMMHLDDLRQAL